MEKNKIIKQQLEIILSLTETIKQLSSKIGTQQTATKVMIDAPMPTIADKGKIESIEPSLDDLPEMAEMSDDEFRKALGIKHGNQKELQPE